MVGIRILRAAVGRRYRSLSDERSEESKRRMSLEGGLSPVYGVVLRGPAAVLEGVDPVL
ncbi:hypothetical protein Microterr_01010 [Microbacterium terricola]|uniref:Uncharacterized protein n=2 Tax=Microbacterium terricola TaxID=344163 RepID=A0ABM8DUZ5_9MICO|nr:hypothetical protein Microterr_01010 [Microbacterium terricola]